MTKGKIQGIIKADTGRTVSNGLAVSQTVIVTAIFAGGRLLRFYGKYYKKQYHGYRNLKYMYHKLHPLSVRGLQLNRPRLPCTYRHLLYNTQLNMSSTYIFVSAFLVSRFKIGKPIKTRRCGIRQLHTETSSSLSCWIKAVWTAGRRTLKARWISYQRPARTFWLQSRSKLTKAV